MGVNVGLVVGDKLGNSDGVVSTKDESHRTLKY